MNIIGIDLGTTNSLVSVFQNGRVVLIPNRYGKVLTPSVVAMLEVEGFTEATEPKKSIKNSIIVVGEEAKERMRTEPQNCASSFKRFMGTKKGLRMAGKRLGAEELSAYILQQLKQDAERFLGEPVEEAIISVPAYFGDAQRRATKRAGELAGLKVERLVNEPSAAALSYAMRQKDNLFRDLLIFDFGGGTLDVSVLETFDNVIEIRAVAGDNHLGGDDFDHLILEYFIKNTKLDPLLLNNKALALLLAAAEQFKRKLSTKDVATMKARINDIDYSITLTNQELLIVCAPLFTRIDKVLHRAMEDSNKSFDELDEIILVGGSSRMPIVKSFLEKLSGKVPLCDFNPEEIVALGAGIAAGMKQRDTHLKEILLSDVCPFSLGIGMVGDKYSPIIERNSILPVSRVEHYFTTHDGQDSILCDIYQGERRKASENYKLGEISMPINPAPAGEVAVDVRFTYDINGILEVEATCVGTDQTSRQLILSENNSIPKEEVARILENMARLKLHPRDYRENKELIRQGERLYAENLGEKRERISELLNYFEAGLETQSEQEIKHRFMKVLSAFLVLEKPTYYAENNPEGSPENGNGGNESGNGNAK